MAGSRLTAAALRTAVDRGVRRLEALASDAHWTGFPTLAGRSDVWVTAFTIAHLDSVAPRRPIIAKARRFLAQRQQASGGWGYGGRGVPADADSTAWCLAAFGASRTLPAAARSHAHSFLDAHETDRGFATYRADSGIREFIEAAGESSIDGWTSVHPDVTASVLLSGHPAIGSARAHALLGRLMTSQTAAGLIPAYWWRPPFYTLAMTLRAFVVHKVAPSRTFVERALEVLDAKQLSNGGYGLGASDTADAFTTALALEAYIRLGTKWSAAVEKVTGALLDQHSSDGEWRGAPVLRIPAPSVTNPATVREWKRNTGGGNALVEDEHGVFATSLACHALGLAVALKERRSVAIDRAWPQVTLPVATPDEATAIVPVTNPPALERCAV